MHVTCFLDATIMPMPPEISQLNVPTFAGCWANTGPAVIAAAIAVEAISAFIDRFIATSLVHLAQPLKTCGAPICSTTAGTPRIYQELRRSLRLIASV